MMEQTGRKYIETNGIKLHVVQQGPEDGRLVILLHGFPEFSFGWRKQMSFLADQGYRVWAPDQRGYYLSDKPEAVKEYRIDRLVENIAGLIEASGKGRAIVVGHDWGGIVAWNLARSHPQLIDRLLILNAPHEAAMSRQFLKTPLQIFRSSYAAFFQLRKVPEKFLQLFDWRVLEKMLQSSSRKGTFTGDELQHYREAWSKPRAIETMINWYRANLGSLLNPKVPDRVTMPVMVIWGAGDQFLDRRLALESLKYCDQGRVVYFENATHWVHLEESERVNQYLLEFIRDERYVENRIVSLP